MAEVGEQITEKGTFNLRDEKFVVKSINYAMASEKNVAKLTNEIETMRLLSHPNIIRLIDVFTDEKGSFNVVTAHFDSDTTLHRRIREKRKQKCYFSESTISVYLAQLASAVGYLHSKNIIHRNLKSQSIYETDGGILKLGNFGLSRIMEDAEEFASTIVGTPYYMAPEFFRQIPYTFKVDIWALGCIVFEMTTLRHAFVAHDIHSLASLICHGAIPQLPEGLYSQELENLAKSMLSDDPNDRPSAKSILRLAFIQNTLVQFHGNDNFRHLFLSNETARANRRKRKTEQRHQSSDASVNSPNIAKELEDTSIMTIPSGINALVDRPRLAKRIEMLHAECYKGLGIHRFHEAWQIFVECVEYEKISADNRSSAVGLEKRLKEYLGEEDFKKYAAKLIDLKFCEDLRSRRLFSGHKPRDE